MSDRIAIVGYDARLPAGSGRAEIDAFLASGDSAVADVPREAMAAAGLAEHEYTRAGYVARSARTEWTPETGRHLAGLTPHELAVTDPQHLLFLDCCAGALADAGLTPETARGREIGVVGGIGMGLYAGQSLDSHFTTRLQRDPALRERLAFPEVLIGNSSDHSTGRVSYRLGLTGPNANVQTACSTALAAVDHAVLLLRAGRADTVLAGAAALYFPDRRGYQWERGGILSPTGSCRAFDSRADGTVGGSGGGVLVLRRLDDALADGDTVHGVIEGAHSAGDGAQRASYAAPAFDGQVRVIRRALADAGAGPDDIAYLEGHGTGTTVGDLVELGALHEVFGGRRAALPVGSVKPALGHLDTAAGIASLVNVLLGLRRGWMPPTANFAELPADARDWIAQPSAGKVPLDPTTAKVGVSAFGASGTSVHLVVSGPPTPLDELAPAPAARARETVVVTAPAAPAAPAAAPDRPHGRDEVAAGLIEVLRERGDFGHLDDEQLLEVGLLDFGIDSVDLLAVSKVVEQRWGVAVDVLDLLAVDSVRAVVDLITSGSG
ncbi:beta-ketoacyl synthase N-terminal-like domain-containing protein [Actinokineospora pegani]|uniref:beta-ketoacyl synthase N-terminal-like domain-containing protein n=1 Tax=Actinokineospora pegani TaxID=2654637 RepID=UPI0012EA4892|nr:beta-ketoacyl synthase N-terminal-like domain-containing protein [Actinokineospora pegani]